MAKTVTVYRWDDAGAPQLVNGKPSEIIDILTKCLVDGYGSKLPLGWSKPFDDPVNRVAVFRNNSAEGASGGYLRVADASGSDATNGNIRITAAVSMTDVNTAFNAGYFDTTSTSGNTVRNWVIIGTNSGFYFLSEPAGSLMAGSIVSTLSFFAGDITSIIPNDAGRFIAYSSFGKNADSSTPSSWNNSLDSLNHNLNGSPFLKIWDADGGASFRQYALVFPFSALVATTTFANQNGVSALPQILAPYMLAIYAATPTAPGTDRNGTNQWSSQLSPLYRGFLPGLVAARFPEFRTEPWPLVRSINGKTHWMLRNPHAGAPSVYIELESWDDPFVSI